MICHCSPEATRSATSPKFSAFGLFGCLAVWLFGCLAGDDDPAVSGIVCGLHNDFNFLKKPLQ
jgi:hypothetical protein